MSKFLQKRLLFYFFSNPCDKLKPKVRIPSFFFIILVFFILLCCKTFAKTKPFSPGERLRFQVRCCTVPAGEIVLEVHPPTELNGITSNHFVMTAKTNHFVDVFYKVRNRIDAYANIDMSHSLLYYKQQREGKTQRDIIVKFDWSKGEAEYSNFGKKEKPISIATGSFDPLSLFYSFRSSDLNEETAIEAPVTNGKECVISRLKVIGKEEIILNQRTYDTYLVQPELGEISGVFEKSKKARLKIWVTADKLRMPIKIWGKMSFGSCVAELIEVEQLEF